MPDILPTHEPGAGPLFLCIGDIDVDVLVGVDRLPTRDSKVNGARLQRVPGGMAGNAAMALARLEARVRLVGRVGEDADGAFALAGLDRSGVDTRHVVRLAGVETFVCIGLITPDGEKSLVKLVTAAFRPRLEDLAPDIFHGVAHAHLTFGGDPDLSQRIVETARRAGATCSLDMELADLPPDRADLARSIAGFDLLFCNAEARHAMNRALGDALRALAPTLITTLGAAGSRIERDGYRAEAAGFAVEVKDTTGAGDCFAAACLHARLAQRLDWDAALRFANTAAALSTTGYGSQSALPTRREIGAALAGSPPADRR